MDRISILFNSPFVVKYQGILGTFRRKLRADNLYSLSRIYFICAFVVINYKLGNVGSFLETIFIPLIGALAGALIANVIVFILHFINSKRDLYNEIGVRRYSDFDIKKVEVQFSTGNVFPPQLHLSVINRSPYLLKDCGIYGCSISTISEHPKTIPETRLLRWIDRQSGKRDLKDNSAVFVFETKERDHINEYGWFATQSISPHKVQHGTCIAKLELRANYLWKKVKFPITIRIVYGQNHVEGTLLQSA